MKVPLRVLFILEDASVLVFNFWFLGAQVGRIRSPELVALKIRSSGTFLAVCVWHDGYCVSQMGSPDLSAP
ncbi:hypothetical protein GCM10007855_41740 [Aliivibrio sifiae]|uniref:Secreted protein n=1 Tax=Aliivibrio sifiae TaxID=566293 RepID=A0ABQ6ALZ8_9GAMM|nr:hypothetical protein GCM10007855_41740 [Aliivibrio sifiae]